MKRWICELPVLLWLLMISLPVLAAAGETVNINTADADTIGRVLVDVGPSKAQAIVAYREANGAFSSPEQLAMVKGVGLRTVEQNRARIVVAAPRLAVKPGAQAKGQQLQGAIH